MGLSGPKILRPFSAYVCKNLRSISTTLWTIVRSRVTRKLVHIGCCCFRCLGWWGLLMSLNSIQKSSTGDPPAHSDVGCDPRSGAHSKFTLLGPVCPFGRAPPTPPPRGSKDLVSAPFHHPFKSLNKLLWEYLEECREESLGKFFNKFKENLSKSSEYLVLFWGY